MELATIFLIWIAITVIDNLAKRKKSRIPTRNDSPNFDIPTLSNDPNLPSEEVPIFIENPSQAEIRQKNSTPPRPKINSAPNVVEEEKTQSDLNLTPSTVMNAFIFSEIIGKPKALRRNR